MATTVVYEGREAALDHADRRGDELWIPLDALEAATGWDPSPEGLCRGDACVAIPGGARWVDEDGGRIDVAGFARYLGHPVVHDESGTSWAFGPPVSARRAMLASLEAPDFELADLDGRLHRLSEHRGKKVFLFSWGSY